MKSDDLDFWNKYELLSSSDNYEIKGKVKTCRYCKRIDTETTFKQVTHLLPELIGENDVHTYDECDTCNKLFSGYETHLSNFIRPYMTLLGVKSKKKVPDFQSRTEDGNETTRTFLKHKENNIKELHIQSLDDYTIDEKNKTLEISFRKPKITPIKVYKALLKIGLSLMPSELDHFNKESFDWLVNKQQDLNFVNQGFLSTLKQCYFKHPSAYLYRAKMLADDTWEFPEHILILCFANQIFQIFLPFSEELKNIHRVERTLEINLFPGFAFDKSNTPQIVGIKCYNLGINASITENHKISFTYESAEINMPEIMIRDNNT